MSESKGHTKAALITGISAEMLGEVIDRITHAGECSDADVERLGVIARALKALAWEEGYEDAVAAAARKGVVRR